MKCNFIIYPLFYFILFFHQTYCLVIKIKLLCLAAHSSFCGSQNVKDLVTEGASHLNLNGSLCKHTHTYTLILSLHTWHFTSWQPWLTELMTCVTCVGISEQRLCEPVSSFLTFCDLQLVVVHSSLAKTYFGDQFHNKTYRWWWSPLDMETFLINELLFRSFDEMKAKNPLFIVKSSPDCFQ